MDSVSELSSNLCRLMIGKPERQIKLKTILDQAKSIPSSTQKNVFFHCIPLSKGFLLVGLAQWPIFTHTNWSSAVWCVSLPKVCVKKWISDYSRLCHSCIFKNQIDDHIRVWNLYMCTWMSWFESHARRTPQAWQFGIFLEFFWYCVCKFL